jgi:pimeloyl-ACP methyl ester carboxylesterase
MRARSTLAALAAVLATAVFAPGAHAAIPYTPCGTPAGFQCGALTVPLDRTGAVPGTVTLHVERLQAATSPTATAVVALAGGPGEAALPFASDFAGILRPALAGRDLLVFDQRGTGTSGRLRCPALEDATVADPAPACAAELGAARGSYRTADSVDDIEAIRQQSGYAKLVLFGVSYGTKVAGDYAAKYPGNVEALVIDSVVPPEGIDVLKVSTFRAMPRVLAQLCAGGACHGITGNPLRDLRTLVRRAGRRAISGTIHAPTARRLRVRVDQDGLYDILLAGDANPTLRAELPGAVRSALRGDRKPLLRLFVRAAGLTGIPGARARSASAAMRRVRAQGPLDSTDSDALLLATRCEESVFPWDRNADPITRANQAVAAARAHPASDFSPFDFRVALRSDAIPLCVEWPDASPPPAPPSPLPAVRTLLISGDDDLRTPREDAQSVAARVPGAQLLTVPFTGHSVVGTDLSTCTATAIATFFAGAPVAPCAPGARPFAPTPVAPTRLRKLPGRTKARKTVAAATATVGDVVRQFVGDAIAAGSDIPRGARVAGLRSGGAVALHNGFRLRRVVYVPGVVVSGRAPFGRGTARLTIGGRAAAHGRIVVHANGSVTGRLGGRRVRVPSARAAAVAGSSAVAWPSRLPRHPPLVGLG